jgi:hypothetical protein
MFPGVPKMRDLEPIFTGLGDWVRYGQTNWLLWTDFEIPTIYQHLAAHLDIGDNVFIADVEKDRFVGRLQPWIWSWIKSKMPDVVTIPGLPSLPLPPGR